MKTTLLIEIEPSELIEKIRLAMREELAANNKAVMGEKFLTAAELSRVFVPNLSRYKIKKLCAENVIQEYLLSNEKVYKYSQVVEALKAIKRFSTYKVNPLNNK